MLSKSDRVFLRTHLREATRPVHDALDAHAGVSDLCDPEHYAAFLSQQLAARLPIERYVEQYLAGSVAPPATTTLLFADLEALGRPFSLRGADFTMPEGADPIGLAWALAGSHLGNRAMRAGLGDTELPTRFLDDPAMIAFWRELRPALERDVAREQGDAAALAANAVFDTFLSAFAIAQDGRLAA